MDLAILLIILCAANLFSFFYVFVWPKRRPHLRPDPDELKTLELISTARNVWPELPLATGLRLLYDSKGEQEESLRQISGEEAETLRRRIINDRILLAREMAKLTMHGTETQSSFTVLQRRSQS